MFPRARRRSRGSRRTRPALQSSNVMLQAGSCKPIATVFYEKVIPFVVSSASAREDVADIFLHGIR